MFSNGRVVTFDDKLTELVQKRLMVQALLLGRLLAGTRAEQFRISVPVDSERAECRKLMRGSAGALDPGRSPVFVSRYCTELLEGETRSERVSRVRECVLVADVHVLDRDLHVIDDGGCQRSREGLILLLLFFGHALGVPLLQQFGRVQLFHLDCVRAFLFLFCIVLLVLFGCS